MLRPDGMGTHVPGRFIGGTGNPDGPGDGRSVAYLLAEIEETERCDEQEADDGAVFNGGHASLSQLMGQGCHTVMHQPSVPIRHCVRSWWRSGGDGVWSRAMRTATQAGMGLPHH
ncbi:hypothetical protein KGY14_05440 [Ameyamaea chiangmaiensis]|uniref:Uncharacterized protein n=1 Tax=Ameyamaea chiangmaiensis TaxID=442969 RepID=A0A850P627_9PROT|nr:hypothetical protein [Ameyamaea chiangmaiensis]MBS4074633.1 hypothetical protein [Ameyamaea chiangmaiensis]NVN39388.1 hypothetical protein [Ameyamaea chiangmaiensis]